MAKNAAGNKPRPTQTVKPAVVAPPPDWTALANQYAMPVLWGLLGLGLILRVVQLDALSLWIDEFVHVLRAKGVAEGTGPLFTDDNNGILLTILQVPLFKIFGAGSWIARIPSVLFGVGTIWLLYRIGWQLFGRHVGLLAAGGATISLYLIFWSRISRNYAIFAFFFLLLSWLFLKVFESRKNDNNPKNYLDYVWVGLALMASLLSHQLTVFFAFIVGVYSIVMAAGKIINTAEDRFKNKYFIVACLAIPVLAVMLIPGLNNLLRAPLSTLLSAQQIDWVLPNTQHLSELWAKRPWESFGIYNGVLRYEMTLLYPLGLLGFVVAFTMNKRSAIWLASAFWTPFLLMSFIFRDPALPRYFIFVYPWFLLSAAVGGVWLFRFLSNKFFTNASTTMHYALLALPVLIWAGSVRWLDIKKLVLAEQREGHVVNANIASFNFTNWKQPCDYLKSQRKPGDVIMSTVTTAAGFYLNEENVVWFRQNYYDTKNKRYAPMPANPDKNSAATFDDLRRTIQNNPRGWLLADYYMDNVMVDDRCRQLVFQNMQFYPEASADGSVMLFGWDNTRPRPEQQNMVIQLGKAADKVVGRDITPVLPAELVNAPNGVEMLVRVSGVDTEQEALVIFNGDNAVYLSPNKQKGAVELQRINIQPGWLRPGANVIQVAYDEEKIRRDPDKGFTMYYINFAPK